jgi:hypothetical protein
MYLCLDRRVRLRQARAAEEEVAPGELQGLRARQRQRRRGDNGSNRVMIAG